MTRPPRPPVLAAVLLAAVVTAGCTATNSQTTMGDYTPSDGVEGRSGNLTLTSVLIVASEEGAPGNLIARAVNGGDDPIGLTLSGSDEAAFEYTVDVAPNDTVDIGPEGQQVLIDSVDVVPGALVPVTATVDGGETFELTVPVLDGTLEEYADLVPTDAAASGP